MNSNSPRSRCRLGSYNSDDTDRPRWGAATHLEYRYEYHNADGTHAYYIDKGRNPDGQKVFRCWTFNTMPFGDRLNPEDKVDEYVGKRDDQPWVLYRLPELIAAPPDQPVFVCEGEKDAASLTALGLLATTCPNGAEKWRGEYSSALAGRPVVLLPDNDIRGHRHARQIMTSVYGVASSIRVVEPPNAKDITEWLEAGHTKDELLKIVEKAELVNPDAWLGQDAMVLRAGSSPEIVDNISERLRAARMPIYQRGGELVRPVQSMQEPEQKFMQRAEQAVILKAVNARWLTEQCERLISFKRAKLLTKEDENGNAVKVLGYAAADLPLKYAETYLARGEWKEPVLRAVMSAPTLLGDGTILQEPGYDARSRLLLDFEPTEFSPIPENPTRADAVEALKVFDPLLGKFPFVDEAARAVAMSALLTAVIRASLETAPLHAFDAPVPGTGKSLIATMAGVLATGHKPAMMSQGKSEEEDEKRLSTVMMEGDPVIVLDNCERPVGGDFVCSSLTETTVQARILGKSERRILPTTALMMATGNNLVITGDMVRRAVICRMDAGVERPELRRFDFDPVAKITAHRPELIVAALTALRAYKLAAPRLDLSPMGSFEDWSWIRGTLVWCGYADPADTRQVLFNAEPQRAELAGVLQLWAEVVGDRKITVAEIGAADYGAPLHKLQEALTSAAGTHGWNARSAGRWLLRHKDQFLGGMVLRVVSAENSRVAEYQLQGASAPEEKPM